MILKVYILSLKRCICCFVVFLIQKVKNIDGRLTCDGCADGLFDGVYAVFAAGYFNLMRKIMQ
jgi:hypothetical protein